MKLLLAFVILEAMAIVPAVWVIRRIPHSALLMMGSGTLVFIVFLSVLAGFVWAVADSMK